MFRYRVTYEVRHLHALGTWHRKTDEMNATDPLAAACQFMMKYQEDYEFRSPCKIEPLETVQDADERVRSASSPGEAVPDIAQGGTGEANDGCGANES